MDKESLKCPKGNQEKDEEEGQEVIEKERKKV